MSINLNLSFITKRKTADFMSTFNSIKSSMVQIADVPVKKKREKAVIEIKKHVNLNALTQDTISIKDGDKKYSIISPTPYQLRIVERGIKSKHIEKDLFINNGNLVSAEGFKIKDVSPELYIGKVFELFEKPFLMLRKSFSNQKFVDFIDSFKVPKSLDDYNSKLANDITELYRNVDKKIISIQNPQTRSGVKNGYLGIKLGTRGSKQLEFVGSNGKIYSVNILIDAHKKPNLVIGVTDENNLTRHIIVESDGKVLKSKKINKRHDTGDRAIYYKENEVNSAFISDTLSILKSEMVKYDAYVTRRLAELDDFRYKYSTTQIGAIKFAVLDKLADIKEKNAELRNAMKWLKKDERINANEKLGIKLRKGKNHSITLKRVGQYKETIHLSFPVLENTPCVKILILNRNNKVDKTYLIKDGGLVKFEAKDTSNSKWAKTIYHYHTQDEIDNSSLNTYVDEIQTRFAEISEIIKVKNWQKK